MAHLENLTAANVTLSEQGWPYVSTLHSSHIRGLRTLLAQAQDNVCAGCGDSLDGLTTELAHIVAAPKGKGIVPGNVYVACKACNDFDREHAGADPFAVLSSLVRPDLVQTSHPDRAACMAATDDARKASVIARRGALLAR